MNDVETEFDEETSEKKPRKSRKRNEERRVFVYRIIDGKPKEQGAFPETAIGTPLERRLPTFLKELFGEGEYRTEIRKPNGHFERAFDFSIATEPDRADREKQNLVEFEPEESDEDELEDFSFDGRSEQLTAEVENLLLRQQLKRENASLREQLKRLEDKISRQESGSQSETQTLISALEESRREQRELMLMMLSQSQKPQQDATTQAMNILEKSLGIVTKAKAISEEIAPQETNSNGSFLGDAASFMDSLGRNAGQLLPIVLGSRATAPAAKAPTARKTPKTSETNGNGQGELTDLLNKVKSKKEGENK